MADEPVGMMVPLAAEWKIWRNDMFWNVSRIPKTIPIWMNFEFEDDRTCFE